MSIDAIGASLTATSTQQNNPANLFKQLAESLQNGDLSGAQAAYQALQQNAPAGANSSANSNSPFAALGAALQSGNLQDAQTAFSQMQAAHKGGHHHHHGGGAAPTQSATTATPTQTQALAPEGAGTELDVTI
jgi:outer membrane protein assembly factor BamD (BamD/ComL family)